LQNGCSIRARSLSTPLDWKRALLGNVRDNLVWKHFLSVKCRTPSRRTKETEKSLIRSSRWLQFQEHKQNRFARVCTSDWCWFLLY
jgi:hypothetical protein